MASKMNIFSIYKAQNSENYYLIRTERPSFSNFSQNQENLAYSIEQDKRNYILLQIKSANSKNLIDFEFIGELQNNPIGDRLYAHNGSSGLNIYYMETEFGQPWIIIGNASSETEFLAELNEDEDLLKLKPIGKPKHIEATFITENDFEFYDKRS